MTATVFSHLGASGSLLRRLLHAQRLAADASARTAPALPDDALETCAWNSDAGTDSYFAAQEAALLCFLRL